MYPKSMMLFAVALALACSFTARVGHAEEPAGTSDQPPTPPIPLSFTLDQPGYVTLVVEDAQGKRVRNLFAGEHFDAGSHTVHWDGLGEGEAFRQQGVAGYEIRRDVVEPGSYSVRGIVRDRIKLTYEFTVYPNVEHTPWKTDEGNQEGGWLGDHGNPTATLFVPAERSPTGEDAMLLTNSVNEAGHGMAVTDLQGKKLIGQRHIGGSWTGASHLAYDRGEKAHPEIYAYTRMDWRGSTKDVNAIRLTGLSPRDSEFNQKSRKHHDFKIAWPDLINGWEGGNPGGLAVHNCLLIASAYTPGRLLFFDTRGVDYKQEAEFLGEVPLKQPHALTFDLEGRLLVLTGDQLVRYEVGSFPNPLSKPQTIISDGLTEPRTLAVDNDGRIFVGEWGDSHQVKMFDGSGKLLKSFGNPGGPQTGPFDPQRMAFPYGLSVDSQGKLWVASRRWWVPKVIWNWDTNTGEHVHNFYGPTMYGGGGTFDPTDPTRLIYHNSHGGIEFEVDWEAGTGKPTGIYHLDYGAVNDRTNQNDPLLRFRGSRAETPYEAFGQRYITNFSSQHTTGTSEVYLLKDNGSEAARPLMIFGMIGTYEPQLKKLGLYDQFEWINDKRAYHAARKTLFLWLDENDDGTPQAEEFTFHLPEQMLDPNKKKSPYFGGKGTFDTIALGPNLEVYVHYSEARGVPGGLLRFTPTSVDDDGMPRYDLSQFDEVVVDPHGYRGAATTVMKTQEGGYVIVGGPIAGYDKNGEQQWLYHSQWPSLHAGHGAPRSPEFSGQLQSTTRVLSYPFKPAGGEAGELWALNSDLGLAYLFTTDGLLVDVLFAYDDEGRRWNFLEHERGLDVTDVNFVVENFHPTINQLSDGRTVMVVGKTNISIVEVHNLDTIKRFKADTVQLTGDDVARVKQYTRDLATWERSQQEGDKVVRVTRAGKSIKIDGDLDDWADPRWVTVQRETVASGFRGRDVDYTRAALSYDQKNLYIAIRCRSRNVLANEAADITQMFTTGGGLDIHLATRNPSSDRKPAERGDVRVLITQPSQDSFVAARYRPVVPGAKDPLVYHSSVAETTIDAIDDVSDRVSVAVSSVELKETKNKSQNYEQIEAAIPLDVLGWDPAKLSQTIGDIGVLYGDAGTTTRRVYWHNKATGLVSDLPSEARLLPSMWGPIEVQR